MKRCCFCGCRWKYSNLKVVKKGPNTGCLICQDCSDGIGIFAVIHCCGVHFD